MDSQLPTELWLHCFSFMTLKTLIASRGVSSSWRNLIPISDIHPIRRRLLNLFYKMLGSRRFLESRAWVVENLQPFDRKAYIEALIGQYPSIPDEFRLWILEWPGRMAIRCNWPGLPFIDYYGYNNIEREPGVNFLGVHPPQLSALINQRGDPNFHFTPGLLAWRGPDLALWVIFDEKESDIAGRVLIVDEDDDQGTIPANTYEYFEGIEESELHDDSFAIIKDWVSFMEAAWKHAGGDEEGDGDAYLLIRRPYSDRPVQGTNDEFVDGSYRDVPAPPWSRRHEPQFQSRLARLGH